MLLKGECGYGSFRFLPAVSVDDWFRSFDPLGRRRDARRQCLCRLPPYNIEKTGEDMYQLTMAVAGFSPDELDVTVQENSLVVTGKAKKDEHESRYLHRGIARRAFKRHFSLAV